MYGTTSVTTWSSPLAAAVTAASSRPTFDASAPLRALSTRIPAVMTNDSRNRLPTCAIIRKSKRYPPTMDRMWCRLSPIAAPTT